MEQSTTTDQQVENNASQKYTSFEDLSDSEWIHQVIEKWCIEDEKSEVRSALEGELSDGTQWKQQFDAIDKLRGLNKFQSHAFSEKIFPYLIDLILQLAESIRSNLQKNALLLLTELLQVNPIDRISTKHLHAIQRVLFEKSISEKAFIKHQAKTAVAALEENPSALSDHNLEGIQNICFDKNPLICELACTTLHKIILSKKDNLTSIKGNALESLVSSQSKCLQGKRALLKKLSKEILAALFVSQGNLAFESLSEQDRQLVITTINTQKNEQKPSFRDFLALKKKDQP